MSTAAYQAAASAAGETVDGTPGGEGGDGAGPADAGTLAPAKAFNKALFAAVDQVLASFSKAKPKKKLTVKGTDEGQLDLL